jgi:hypothetical protein
MVRMLLSVAIACAAVAGVVWSTQMYDASLRHPRFLDGWLLATAMLAQLLLHFHRKRTISLPGSENAWMMFHIYTGFFVVAVFAMHTSYALPDTSLEWALWILFVLVAASGIAGAHLTRAIPLRLADYGERLAFERFPTLISEAARRAAVLSYSAGHLGAASAIVNVYETKLFEFFRKPKNLWLHLRNSRRPIKQLMFELEAVESSLDPGSLRTLHEIKGLVERKNRLDFQYAHECALKVWLFVHIPATYGLVVLTVLHVLAIYAFRSGVE